MRIIVPMAGMGKRMRPHTLTVPKPLLPVAGKPVVQRLVEDLAAMCADKVEEIAYVVGRFGKEAEDQLVKVAESLGAKGSIYYQDEALGTAHAVWCARESLKGPVIIAFADTLFRADFKINPSADGTIWVKHVDNPSAFGVVKTNDKGVITEFIEKPKTPVSNLAIIGIYHFKSGENLRKEIDHIIDNNVRGNNEYQLTDALENMKQKGVQFITGTVNDWLDCGNKNATVDANQKMLGYIKSELKVPADLKQENSKVHQPCFIGKGVVLKNAEIGPYVSVGDNTIVQDSKIENSIIGKNTRIESSKIVHSMIGNSAEVYSCNADLSVGDFNVIRGSN